jgi:hypothetical protein
MADDALLLYLPCTRCAAVIAWLESMADDALSGGPGGVGQPRFAEHEGVWLETKHRLGQGVCVHMLLRECGCELTKVCRAYGWRPSMG